MRSTNSAMLKESDKATAPPKSASRVPRVEERIGSQKRPSTDGILVVAQYKRLRVTNPAPIKYEIKAYPVRD